MKALCFMITILLCVAAGWFCTRPAKEERNGRHS